MPTKKQKDNTESKVETTNALTKLSENQPSVIKKKKRFSKSKKKNQRKIDLSDIEKAYEQRGEDRLKGGAIEKRKNETLFTIDTSGNNETKSKIMKWREKKLTAEQIIAPNPHIQAVVKEKPTPKDQVSKVEEKLVERKARNLITHEKNIKTDTKSNRKRKKASESNPTYDLWASEPRKTEIEKKIESDEYLHILKHEIHPPTASMSSFSAPPSLLPAIPLPNPGHSYNPTYEDHQNLLGEAMVEELGKEDFENKIKSQIPKNIGKAFDPEDEVMKIEEEQEEEQVEENEETPRIRPPQPERKTKKQRNAEKERRLLAAENAKKRINNRILRQIDRIDQINERIEKREEKLEERRQQREEEKLNEPFKTKKLGPYKFQEDPLPVVFSDELPQHLRQVSMKVNPHRELLQSFQRRNILEVRKKVKAKSFRRTKVKFVNKKNMEVNL